MSNTLKLELDEGAKAAIDTVIGKYRSQYGDELEEQFEDILGELEGEQAFDNNATAHVGYLSGQLGEDSRFECYYMTANPDVLDDTTIAAYNDAIAAGFKASSFADVDTDGSAPNYVFAYLGIPGFEDCDLDEGYAALLANLANAGLDFSKLGTVRYIEALQECIFDGNDDEDYDFGALMDSDPAWSDFFDL